MMEILGNNIKDKQEELVRILGFDYETFKNTANFEQGGSDSFSRLTPKEAKQAVMKILQLNKFEQLEKRCREQYKLLYDKGTELKTKIAYMEANIDWKEEDTTPLVAKVTEVERELEITKTALDLINQQAEIVYRVNGFQKTISQFESLNVCPTCKQTVGEEHKESLLKQHKIDMEALKKTIDYNIIDKKDLYSSSYSKLLTLLADTKNAIRSINEKKEKLKLLSADRDRSASELEEVKKELTIYKNLIEAFGKNGIPAFIIDSTAPEIENIANTLLEKLDAGFVVKIDTKKVLKSGEIAEAMDINIVTGKYSRPYFNYSGGEKFLIDLTLRVALSIILLRRKGCNNSTLIIDEGLGALDRINCMKVISLINIIQEQYGFQKVLLITHVADIQDMIEDKIEVLKQGTFSTIRYNIDEETKL